VDLVPGAGEIRAAIATHARPREPTKPSQVVHLARTTIVQEAWRRAQSLSLHGLIYGLNDGLLNDLGIEVAALRDLEATHAKAIARLTPSA
jgi:carbonic anhydrase